MPESFLGDGLIFEELLPLEWFPGPLPEGLELARLNADNHQLLGAESTLEEVRVSEAVSKEESSALIHELQRLEYKLNVLLRLTADLVAQARQLSAPQRVRLSARGLEWFEAPSLKRGDVGLLHIYINRTLPQPLKIPCGVAGERAQGGTRVAQLVFRDLSDGVVDMLEKLIFRHHRRRVAGAKTTSP
jgi:Atypical PilZ domain, cyclic di-GMP receptor